MALKRFVDGAAGQPFFQKRAPENVPAVHPDRRRSPSRPAGPPTRSSSTTRRASPGSPTSAASTSTRTRSGPRTSTTPTSCGSTSTRCPGIGWPQIREVALAARESLEAVGLVGWPKTSGLAGHPHQRPDRAALDVPGGAPGGAGARPRRGAARPGPRHLEVVEGGAPRRLPRLQPERQGPDGGVGLLRAAAARRAGVDAADLGRGPDGRGRGVHDRHRAGAVRVARRPGRGDRRGGRVARGAAGAVGARRGARVSATRRGRRTTPSRPASRRASSRHAPAGPKSEYEPGRGEEGGPPPEVAAERAAAVAAGDPNAGLPTEWVGSKPTPTGRRKTTIPVVEIARAEFKDGAHGRLRALEGPPCRHRRRTSSRRTSWSTACAAGPPSGIASGSTSSTCPEDDAAGPGAARIRLRPVGRHGHRGVEGRHRGLARATPDPEAEEPKPKTPRPTEAEDATPRPDGRLRRPTRRFLPYARLAGS